MSFLFHDEARKAAGEPGCDEDEQRFRGRFRKLVKQKPVEPKPE